jgi:hypothetical protein
VSTRSRTFEAVWEPHRYGPTKTLDVHVASLRKKVGDPAWIERPAGWAFGFRSAREHRSRGCDVAQRSNDQPGVRPPRPLATFGASRSISQLLP